MPTTRNERVAVRTSDDVATVRQILREMSKEAGFSLLEQTKIITAGSELARNMIDFAGGGIVSIEEIHMSMRVAIKATFEDKGPGIADIEQAMKDGYSTGSGLGLGLSGSKRLVNEFEIESEPGKGTRVTIVKWK